MGKAMLLLTVLVSAFASVALGQVVTHQENPEAPASVFQAQDAGVIYDGAVIEGRINHSNDVDTYRVCSPDNGVQTLYTLAVETDRTNSAGNFPYANKLYVVYQDSSNRQQSDPIVGDLRSSNHLLMDSSECATVGVSKTGEYDPDWYDPDTGEIIMRQPRGTGVFSYKIHVLASFRAHEGATLLLPGQELHSILEVETQWDCKSSPFLEFPYHATDRYQEHDVMRHIVRIGEGCRGYQVRFFANAQFDCAQLRPDGSVVEVQSYNVLHSDYPSSHLEPYRDWNVRERGAMCYEPLVPGNYLAFGGFVLRDQEGSLYVRRPDRDEWHEISTPWSASSIRQMMAVGMAIGPSIEWSAEHAPLTASKDGFLTVSWQGSNQIEAVDAHLPELDTTITVNLHTDYGTTFSQSAVDGEVFRVGVQTDLKLVEGEVLEYTLTPRGNNGRESFAPIEELIYTSTATVPVEQVDEVPEQFGITVSGPNPTRGDVRLNLSVDTPQQIRVEVYNVQGQQVQVLHREYLSAGSHILTSDLEGLPSGFYIVRMRGERHVAHQKIVLIR